MNRTKLKNYAPQARRDFIQAVTDRAATYGLTAKKTEPMTESGDVVLIGGKAFPKSVGEKRRKLESRIAKDGFGQTMEAFAYLWFNRFAAIRYMELHGYLDHGFRVLNHPEGHPQPEILEKAQHVTLPGLDSKKVLELKLDGTKEEELYRLLLTAQCNALHSAMPFLFERIEDETELLLPDNLLHSDSLIRKLVNEIDEDDWKEVEIIGWLYQFYISERKDEVIGKVVASEDIPAATQLFTPNWIVKYLVQNTLGRQWLATYPESSLRQQMEYYIEPAEQTPEVQEQLKAVTPTSLNPEELTLLDPACGSGHILVEAYDLFKAVYQERGYRTKDIPALILQKNLFGMEIDDRAAQLAAFALMMKARADDRRIFDGEAKPNIIALQESEGLDPAAITHALNSPINQEDGPKEFLFEELQEEKDGLFSKKAMAQKGHVSKADIAALVDLFEHAKTFGSLIQVPADLAGKLPEIEKRLDDVLTHGDLTHASVHVLKPLLEQARLLSQQYDAVVANPPYLGRKGMNDTLKSMARSQFEGFDSDLFAMFMRRNASFCRKHGQAGFMTPFVWMFIASHQRLREWVLSKCSLLSLVHPEYHSFFDSAFVPICAFVIGKSRFSQSGIFVDLRQFYGAELQEHKLREAAIAPECSWRFAASAEQLSTIPGSPIAYWVSDLIRGAYRNQKIGDLFEAKEGLGTRDDDIFLRRFWEVDASRIQFNKQKQKWVKTDKAGGYRRWAGGGSFVMNWENDGYAIRNHRNDDGSLKSRPQNTQYFFRRAVSWGKVGSGISSFRYRDDSWAFNDAAPSLFGANLEYALGLLNSKVFGALLQLQGGTLNVTTGVIASLPFIKDDKNEESLTRSVKTLIEIETVDWDCNETSWGFARIPLLNNRSESSTIGRSFDAWVLECDERRDTVRRLEEENNRTFIELYGFQSELTPEVPNDQITIYIPDREEDIKRLLSYAIGCMMGRYSLDNAGLIYARSGNLGFDPNQYQTFRADDDGIIPLFETDWGIRDDATNRFVEFICVAWPKEHLEENLKFVADSLGPTGGEQPRDTIRRYLSTGFYKHHLSMYKKRPIYWLFSSGKQKAFQCLVYLHRYNEGTLSRMRTEYVIPLLGKMNGRLQQLDGDITASSATGRRKLEKERDTLKKQLAELQEFDARLRHYADLRIQLDLDDGVKVNYGKFSDPNVGDILAEVKAICGTKDED